MRLKKMCQHEQELAITPTPKEDKDLADLDVSHQVFGELPSTNFHQDSYLFNLSPSMSVL